MRTLLASAALVSVVFIGCARDRLPHPVGVEHAGPLDGASIDAALADSRLPEVPAWAALGVGAIKIDPPEAPEGEPDSEPTTAPEPEPEPETPTAAVCPEFDDCSSHALSDGCLIRCDLALPWAEAAMTCMEIGGRLAVPTTAGINALLTPPQGFKVWIGVSDLQQEGRFVGLGDDELGFSNWGPGEPNDTGGEDCTEIYSSGAWNDNDCGLRNFFGCDRVPPVAVSEGG